jgi:hypothetical protein
MPSTTSCRRPAASAASIISAIENLSGQMADMRQSLPSVLDFARLKGRVDVIEKTLGLTSKES